MAKTKYFIQLTEPERALLTKIICEKKESERTIKRAKILLMSEATQPEKLSIKKLAELLETTDTTIQTVRTEFARDGLQAAVYRKPRTVAAASPEEKRARKPSKPYKRRIDDEAVRQIRALVDEQPPEGHKKWSTRLVCKEAVRRGIVAHIAAVTVGKILNGEAPYN